MVVSKRNRIKKGDIYYVSTVRRKQTSRIKLLHRINKQLRGTYKIVSTKYISKTGMSKNEKNYYMTRITELILSSVVIAVNIVPLELFAAFKLPMILLDARIWTILFCVCILFCIALDSLFQFRGTWQQQKELVQELKNECLKYSYKLGAYAKNTDQMERKVMFLQRFLEMTGEKYSLFEYHKTQEQKDEMKKQELQEVEKQEVA